MSEGRAQVPISVTIPVGPHPHNTRWLDECVQSILDQTVLPYDICFIDDGGYLAWRQASQVQIGWPVGEGAFKTPWRSGVAHSFNFGVALSECDLVLMLGSDDKLYPHCIEQCWQTWQAHQHMHGYYFLPIEYADGRRQHVPCNAAMVHKALWHLTGGFPFESAVGACDTVLISMMIAANGRLGTLIPVGEAPLYWYRNHPETDTEARRYWHNVAAQVRNIKTAEAAGTL